MENREVDPRDRAQNPPLRVVRPDEVVTLGVGSCVSARCKLRPSPLPLTETEETQWYFVAPAGGSRISIDDQSVQAVSLKSPLGRALAGLEVDDAAKVESPKGLIELEIVGLY